MRALVVLLVGSACGRVGFDAHATAGDGAIFDAAGSGSATPFVPFWHSGPRLRARLLTGGGDPIFYGWHDSQLDTDCQPTTASDGMERCMPYRARADTLYSDPSCTQPLALVYQGTCGKDTYAFTDGGGTHAYPIGALYSGAIYANAGSCAPTSLTAGQQAYVIGAEEPASSFPVSSYSRQLVGGFVHSINVFSDGASVDIRLLELASSACNPVAPELGAVRCRTGAPRAMLAYGDGACTQPILVWVRTPYDLPSATQLEVFPPQACDATYALYDVVADVTAPTYYVSTPTGCASVTTPATAKLYTATQAADPAPMGTVVRGPDRGRIGTLYWIGPDGVALAAGNFDQQLGNPCWPFNASDGVLRCLPKPAVAVQASPDATCTAAPVTMAAACYGVPPARGPGYTSCIDGAFKVRTLPATFASASLLDSTNTCDVIDLPGGTGYDATAPGAEIPPATFPQLIEIVE